MIEIEKPRLDTEHISEDGSFGRFVVSPLERVMVPRWAIPCVGFSCLRFPAMRRPPLR